MLRLNTADYQSRGDSLFPAPTACGLYGYTLAPFSCFHFSPSRFTRSEGSILVSEQLRTYPSPNATLTLTYYYLTIVGLGEGWVRSCSKTDIPFHYIWGGRWEYGTGTLELENDVLGQAA